MLRTRFAPFLLLPFLALGACSSGGPKEIESRDVYEYDFDFLWDEAQNELRSQWRIETADRETKTLVTVWDVRLSPFRARGERHRLTVAFLPTADGKWKLKATQESEENDEVDKPLDPEEASWSSKANDGALAAKFLVNFDRRMRPNDAWRRQTRR
jgi:hypothetical protein